MKKNGMNMMNGMRHGMKAIRPMIGTGMMATGLQKNYTTRMKTIISRENPEHRLLNRINSLHFQEKAQKKSIYDIDFAGKKSLEKSKENSTKIQ